VRIVSRKVDLDMVPTFGFSDGSSDTVDGGNAWTMEEA